MQEITKTIDERNNMLDIEKMEETLLDHGFNVDTKIINNVNTGYTIITIYDNSDKIYDYSSNDVICQTIFDFNKDTDIEEPFIIQSFKNNYYNTICNLLLNETITNNKNQKQNKIL